MTHPPPCDERRLGRAVWLCLAAATVWIAGACLAMWDQPILADEWDFYRAITNWTSDRALIPHPQAYVHLAQLSQALFGQTVGAARLVGVLSALLTVWLIPLFAHHFWPDHPQRRRIVVGGIVLTALSPLTVQNAMLLDIDNTLLTPTLLGLAVAWAALQARPARQRWLGLGVCTALALWVKWPTPPLLLSAFVGFHLVRGEWRRAGEVALAGLGGALLFAATFLAYSQLSGYEFAYFAPTLSRTGLFFDPPALLARFPQGLGVFALWLSLPLLALLLVALAGSARRLWHRQAERADVLALFVGLVALLYPLLYPPAWGYPRYQAPAVPLIALLVSARLSPVLPARLTRGTLWLGAGGLFVGLFNGLVLPDPLWPVYRATFAGDLYDVARRALTGLAVVGNVALPLGVLLCGGALVAWRRHEPLQRVSLQLLGAATLASLAVLTVVQVTAPYSTRYRYTYDYADYFWAVRTARAAAAKPYLVATKDVLYESGRAGVEIYRYLAPDARPALLQVLQTRRVDALVWTTKEAARTEAVLAAPELVAALRRCYSRQQRGDFIVHVRRPGAPCPRAGPTRGPWPAPPPAGHRRWALPFGGS